MTRPATERFEGPGYFPMQLERRQPQLARILGPQNTAKSALAPMPGLKSEIREIMLKRR